MAAIVEQGGVDIHGLATTIIEVASSAEGLWTIIYLVPLQLFSYWLAVELGCNPDVFRLDDPTHRAAKEQYQL